MTNAKQVYEWVKTGHWNRQQFLEWSQPEQEPVAWMDADGNVSDNNDHNCFPIPLYTTPPQRKPLTDEQILALNFDGEFCLITDDDEVILDFARLVEAAHGIKGDA